MSTPIRASDRDLRALAAIVSQDRTDLPDGEGLPPSLLTDLMAQIPCDSLSLDSWDSGRQTGLLHLVAAGHTTTQIARRLGISEGTVRTHLENIYERLQVTSRTAAVVCAFPDRAA